MIQTLLLPFKIWKTCRYIPVLLFLGQVCAMWALTHFLAPIVWTAIDKGVASGHIPLWTVEKLRLTAILLPWIVYFPCLYALSGYPTRLSFLKTEGITLKDNLSLWWIATEVSFSCYSFIWRFLPWRLLPIIAVFLTRALMPNFLPLQYHTLSNVLFLILAVVTIFRTFPLLFSPLISAIGLYDPNKSFQYCHGILQTKRWSIAGYLVLFTGIFYVIVDNVQFVNRYIVAIPIIATVIAYLLLSVLSVICVRVLAQLESQHTH